MPKFADHASPVDALMERATAALERGEYFEAAGLALRGVVLARRDDDFERMARAALPLQEARRQIRLAASDAGLIRTLAALPGARERLAPGLYLVTPPCIGLDANVLRASLERRRVPAIVLAREPQTRAGLWPLVMVGGGQFAPVVARVRLAPPPGGEVSVAWFLAAHEALGDAAIAQVDPAWPAAHRVDDFLERLEGLPDHEKIAQALGAACREAGSTMDRPPPRRRAPLVDERGF